uniref:YTH domain-containing family protein n=1 Tax=Rhizophora mucronata TaxID=61149 RepID=A0A2P2JRB1_RHIMU
MAATQSQSSTDRTIEEKPAEPDNMKERDTAAIGHPRDNAGQSGTFGLPGDRSIYPPNVYAPQAQPVYYRGYGATGEWDEYPSYVNAEGLEIGSPGVYNDNTSLVFHAGYGYGPHMPYGPYSPVTPPLPSVGGDAQLYSPQQFPFSGPPYYQQLGPPNVPYINSPTTVSQPELNSLGVIDQQGDSMPFGPRPTYPPPLGSFGRGSFPGNVGALGLHDSRQSFGGLSSAAIWSDWLKPSDRHRPLTPLSPAVSPQPVGTFGSFEHNIGMASQQQRSFYGLGSGSNSYSRGHLHGGFHQGHNFGTASFPSLGTNNRALLSNENSRWRGRGNISLCSCNGNLDILNEQNRGPRASKPKNQTISEQSSVDEIKHIKSNAKVHNESYNQPDFVTEYKDAKFFIIKSYSEDNVHKSIKYGVWASTPNGNRKLDTAYCQAKEKQESCPVFLFFSVNASAQFCGVAEMIGPVDFDKNVDFWQQDKWSGQFPVKWHIIKDVPNSQFRHIVLENNDNKPVTNSRDTQEVKVEQGIEMLNIFKNYETDMSILDDFEFYEDRQKAMQERKARQQASLTAVGVVGENEHLNAVALSNDFIKQMPKSFAQVVCLDEPVNEANAADRASSGSDASLGTKIKLDDAITGVSSAQNG